MSDEGSPLPSHPLLPFHPPLPYRNFSDTVRHRPTLPDNSPSDIELFERIVHPYNANAFEAALHKHHLTSSYPLLVHNLSHGFPLGPMPPLYNSIIIKNHPSADRFPTLVDKYISGEIALHRMSGPFSLPEIEHILRGPIYCSPFIVDEQDQGPGIPPKYRVCRNLSKDDPVSGMASVNGFISKEDFPTRFDMSCHVAEAVSCSSASSCSP
jgi:hypothetical protein